MLSKKNTLNVLSNFKKVIFLNLFFSSILLSAQGFQDYGLGGGLKVQSRDYNYGFQLGGAIQPRILFSSNSGELNSRFSPELTFLRLQGYALKEKLSFFIQSDYSRNDLLMDAWLSYAPLKTLKFTFGQMFNVGNNREMLFYEDQLCFADRGLLSSGYSMTGREMGIKIEGQYQIGISGFHPQIMITTGDGRNSFGTDSRDVDLGGYKYSFRLDLTPFGDFSKENNAFTADLAFENRMKLLLGFAGSYNFGASGSVGESHGDFTLYRNNGEALPDYRKWYLDALIKYRGGSLLLEMGQATATSLIGLRHSPVASDVLFPEEISGYLSLGTGYSAMGEIMMNKKISISSSYSIIYPEFGNYPNGVFVATSQTRFGMNYYRSGHNAKFNISYSLFRDENDFQENRISLIFQVRI